MSRLNNCTAIGLLKGISETVIQQFQRLQNAAALLIFKSQKIQRCTPLLKELHWLNTQRIKIKAFVFCNNIVTGSAAGYVCELVPLCSTKNPSFCLRHSSLSHNINIQTKRARARGFSLTPPLRPAVPSPSQSIKHNPRFSSLMSNLKLSFSNSVNFACGMSYAFWLLWCFFNASRAGVRVRVRVCVRVWV